MQKKVLTCGRKASFSKSMRLVALSSDFTYHREHVRAKKAIACDELDGRYI